MVSSKAPTVDAYLNEIPSERVEAIKKVRALIKKSGPKADENMDFGMPTYKFGENMYAALASQKHYMALYANSQVIEEHKQALAHLNCGKSCIRFKSLDDLPLETIQTILKESAKRAASV
ncbi:MAG: DUF1801 domain-containing protein [Chloroflexi bacterium]|nr:MAG: DUF1801 domain-containing protein [Chloroflexota bacterium]MBL1197334.1 DUF1801 domain-containing protein [Chloroflexota bacterium]NOH14629.1 DUF1801 domain-containing protein [Chloroflexota bacterium]